MQCMPSYEVNIESCHSECFSQRENNLTRVENSRFTSYEVNNGFIIQKLHKDVYNLNFCFAEVNKIIYGIIKYNDGIKPGFSPHFWLSRVVDRPGDNLLSPSTLYMFSLFTVLSPMSANFQ